VWSVASGVEVHSWQDTSMTVAAFRPDGQVLAIGHADGAISLWYLAEGQKETYLEGSLGPGTIGEVHPRRQNTGFFQPRRHNPSVEPRLGAGQAGHRARPANQRL